MKADKIYFVKTKFVEVYTIDFHDNKDILDQKTHMIKVWELEMEYSVITHRLWIFSISLAGIKFALSYEPH